MEFRRRVVSVHASGRPAAEAAVILAQLCGVSTSTPIELGRSCWRT
jgi:hypothetical protein